MNTKLGTETKNDFKKDFFKLMNNTVFGKTMENVRKHRDIKLVTTDKRRNQLASEPTYYATKYFSKNWMTIEMKKTKVKINKTIYIDMSILDISKTLMYEFWYDYIKPKYQDKVKLCYMDTNSFFIHIKIEGFYEDIANDVQEWFDTSNYDNDRLLPIGKSKNVIVLFKDEFGGKIMIKFIGLRGKTYAYLMDDDTEQKKAKGSKTCVIKRIFKFNDYEECILNNKIVLKSQERFKSDHRNVCTEQINKIALSSNDDKKLQTFDKIITSVWNKSF